MEEASRGVNLIFFKIIFFTMLLFISKVLATAITVYFVGIADPNKLDLLLWFIAEYGPTSIVSMLVFFLLARSQRSKPYLYAFVIGFLSIFLSSAVTSAILNESLYPSILVLDSLVLMVTLLIGVSIGVKSKGVTPRAIALQNHK